MIEARDPGWLQTPLMAPPITWEATPVAQLPAWTDVKRICLDLECRDDDLYELGPGVRRGGYVCGIAFAIEDGPAHYLPVRHQGGGNLDPAQVWAYVRDQAAGFDGEVVLNGGSYDLDYFSENKIEFPKVKWFRDVQNAEPILDELQRTYNLDAICARRGLPGKDESELREHANAWGVDPKRGLWRLHAGAVARYGIGDVRAPLALLRRQEREIEDQELGETYDLESKVLPALVRMTRRGLRVDLDEMDRVEAWAKERLQSYLDQIHHLTGVRVGSISCARELYPALKKRGLDVPTPVHGGTGKATPSITKLWLQQQTDEVAQAVISGREFAKLLGTYVAGFRKHMVGDRIHPSFKQLRSASAEDDGDEGDEDDGAGARFGRCSAKHPNVQAQMKRSKEIQKRWRKVLVADHGKGWVSGDFSQQEPRLTIHYSEICRLPGARLAGDTLRNDPLYDCYQMLVELVKSEKDTDLGKLRDDLKEVYLGRCYGMGGGKMAKKLKLPTEWKTNDRTGYTYEGAGPEAQELINRFDRGIPYVKALARMCSKSAKAKKYILALGNRRCHFELDENEEIRDEHKALNKLIQGGAAYQTKKALVALDDEGYPLQLTVHDEFDYSTDDDAEARRMAEIMCSVVSLRVPSRVDVKKGRSYGELEKLCTVVSELEAA